MTCLLTAGSPLPRAAASGEGCPPAREELAPVKTAAKTSGARRRPLKSPLKHLEATAEQGAHAEKIVCVRALSPRHRWSRCSPLRCRYRTSRFRHPSVTPSLLYSPHLRRDPLLPLSLHACLLLASRRRTLASGLPSPSPSRRQARLRGGRLPRDPRPRRPAAPPAPSSPAHSAGRPDGGARFEADSDTPLQRAAGLRQPPNSFCPCPFSPGGFAGAPSTALSLFPVPAQIPPRTFPCSALVGSSGN